MREHDAPCEIGQTMDKPPVSGCLAALQRYWAPRYADAAMITPATPYSRVYHGSADQVTRVRRELRAYLDQCLLPDDAADDAILIISEFATNAIRHSRSQGAFFIVRCETFPSYAWVEVHDLGGPWHFQLPDATHGLAIVEALVGPDGWGVDTTESGGRIVWCRISLEGHGHA